MPVTRARFIDSSMMNLNFGDAGKPALIRAAAQQHRAQGYYQQIDVLPDRPITDVIRVQRLLYRDVSVAPFGNLPEPGHAGQNAPAEAAEFAVEGVQVIGGEWPRADQAHIALQHVPKLRQFVE